MPNDTKDTNETKDTKDTNDTKDINDTKEIKERRINYIKLMQFLRKRAIKYSKDPNSFHVIEADIFTNVLSFVKNEHDRNVFNDEEKLHYKEFVHELQSMDLDVVRKEIKNRAMSSLQCVYGDLTNDFNRYNIDEANRYSDLYKLLTDDLELSLQKMTYETQKASEKKMNAGIRDAIDRGDQKALDVWKEKRKTEGFVDVRNQLQEEGFEEGRTFGACSAVLKEMDELKNKENRTPDEKKRYERDLNLRNSNLFVSHMMMTRYMNKNPERDLYIEEKMQESLENSKKRLQENKIHAFEQYRDEHAAQMAGKFERFGQLLQKAQTSYTKKETANFGNVMKTLNAINAYNWNENYGKNSIYEAHQNIYNKGLERALDTLDTYIQGKQKPRFPFMMGKVAKERLDEAKEMRALLAEIQNDMKAFRSYVGEHTMETAALMERADPKKKPEAQMPTVENTFVPHQMGNQEIQVGNQEKPVLFEDFILENERQANQSPQIQHVKTESKPAAEQADEQKTKPRPSLWDASDQDLDFSKKERDMLANLMKSGNDQIKKNTESDSLEKEKTSFLELTNNSSEAKTDSKKTEAKQEKLLQAMRREMKDIKNNAAMKKRPKEAEDINKAL